VILGGTSEHVQVGPYTVTTDRIPVMNPDTPAEETTDSDWTEIAVVAAEVAWLEVRGAKVRGSVAQARQESVTPIRSAPRQLLRADPAVPLECSVGQWHQAGPE